MHVHDKLAVRWAALTILVYISIMVLVPGADTDMGHSWWSIVWFTANRIIGFVWAIDYAHRRKLRHSFHYMAALFSPAVTVLWVLFEEIRLPTISREKEVKTRTLHMSKSRAGNLYFFFLAFCVFVHMVLVLNRPQKQRYSPDDKLYLFGEDSGLWDDWTINPWWTLNVIYFVYVLSAVLYYLGYIRPPARRKAE